MRLEKLYINRQWNGDDLNGEIEFSGKNGKVTITLTDEKIKSVIDAVADALVESSKEVAEKLTAEIIESSTLQIEHKES